MDNQIFNVNGLTKDQLTLTLKLALTDQYAKSGETGTKLVRGWRYSKSHGLILLWAIREDDKRHNVFPVPLNYSQIADIAWEWLNTQEAKLVPCEGWDANAEHDGDNEKGWRVYCEDWGHVDSDNLAIVAIKPAYLWYGK